MKTLAFVLGFLLSFAAPAGAAGITGYVSIKQSTINVAATTDTTVVPRNTNANSLQIYVQTTGASCYLAFDQAAASGQGLMLGSGSFAGNGYAWDVNPPDNAIHVYCNIATTIIVWIGS
jgi:hypothetical protein